MGLVREDIVGRYTVTRALGRGGMADLYLGRQNGIGGFQRDVVIKMVSQEHLEDERFLEMFLDEARVTASLNHPNIVTVFDVGYHNEVPYLAMEFVRGPTFLRLVRRAKKAKSANPAAVVLLLSQVARGLHHAHSAVDNEGSPLNILHRDVTPSNILIDPSGSAKLIDFGVASAEGRLHKTEVGTLKGKLRFMALEQLRSKSADCRADIYALGVSAYWALLGQYPYPQKPADKLLIARLNEDFKRPCEVDEGFDEELEAIVMKMLANDPEDRWGDAEELAEALEAWAVQHDASTASTARWLQTLFPGDEVSQFFPKKEGLLEGYGLTTSQSSHIVIGNTTTSHQVIAPTNRWMPVAIAVLLILLFVGGGTGVWWYASSGQQVADVGDQFADEHTASTLFDQAKAAVSRGEVPLALDLLEQASRLRDVSPELRVSVSQFKQRQIVQNYVTRGERALSLSRLDSAKDLVAQALDLSPSHPQALALLKKLQTSVAAPLVVVSPTKEQAPSESRDKESSSRRGRSNSKGDRDDRRRSRKNGKSSDMQANQQEPEVPERESEKSEPEKEEASSEEPPAAEEEVAVVVAIAEPPPAAPEPTARDSRLQSLNVDSAPSSLKLNLGTGGKSVRPLHYAIDRVDGSNSYIIRLTGTESKLAFDRLPIASSLAKSVRVVDDGDAIELRIDGLIEGAAVSVDNAGGDITINIKEK